MLTALLAAQPARAQILSVSFSFEEMLPGERRSDSAELTVPLPARLVAVSLEEEASEPGVFVWEVELCSTGGRCIPVSQANEGSAVAAGDYTLTVAVELRDGAPALASSVVSGRLVFEEDDDGGLPDTGVDVAVLAAVVVVLLVAGLVLLGLARRRSGPPEVGRA